MYEFEWNISNVVTCICCVILLIVGSCIISSQDGYKEEKVKLESLNQFTSYMNTDGKKTEEDILKHLQNEFSCYNDISYDVLEYDTGSNKIKVKLNNSTYLYFTDKDYRKES